MSDLNTRTVSLSSPLTSHKGSISTITFKEPRARLFVNHGDPFKVLPLPGENFEISFNNKAMLAFMADMSDLDELTLEDMPASDFQKARSAVVDLVLNIGADPESPTEA